MAIFSRKNSDRPELPEGHKDESSLWYVAPELRDDYLAHTPTFHEIKKEVEYLVKVRADEARNLVARERATKRPNLDPPGTGPVRLPGEPDERERSRQAVERTYRAALDEGEQEGDAELAEHRARVAFAKRCKAERDKAERAEKRRQDARCRSCDALDVPTAPAVFTLMPAPRPNHTPGHNNKAQTYTVGNGPVCGHCRVLVIAEERARIASQKVGDSTRGELVKRFLNRARG